MSDFHVGFAAQHIVRETFNGKTSGLGLEETECEKFCLISHIAPFSVGGFVFSLVQEQTLLLLDMGKFSLG